MPQNPQLQKLRQKYPQYADIDDVTLARKVVEKYPQYQADFADLLGGGGPGKPEDQPGYGQRSDIFMRELSRQPIFAPGQTMNRALSQLPDRPVAGGLNVLNALLQTAATPFVAGESALRLIPGGNTAADALTYPFHKIAEGVQSGERLIGEGLEGLGIPNPQIPEAQALSGLNQGLAQMLVPGLMRRGGTPKPSDFLKKDAPPFLNKDLPQKQSAPGLRTAGDDIGVGMTEKAVAAGSKFTPEQARTSWQSRETLANDFKKAIDSKNLEQAKDLALEMQRSREQVEGYIAQKQGREHRAMRPEEIDQFLKEENLGDPLAKITQIIKEAKPVRGETERLYTQERRKRAAKLAQTFEKPEGETTLFKALATQKGELPKAQFESPRGKLTETDITTLFDRITTNGELRPYEKLGASNAFRSILGGEKVPTRYELGLLEKVFGEDFTKAVLGKRSNWQKTAEFLQDVGNFPRALMSSFDMSFPFRQGLVLTVSRPAQAMSAMGDMFRSFASEKFFNESQNQIKSRPNSPLYEETGLYFADMGGRALELTKREEAFMSRLASKIPGIKHSNRAFVAYGNRIRADVFDKLTTDFKKSGFTPENNPEVFSGLAKYLNLATGRGYLGKYGERIAPILNAFIFSPRNLTAKFELLNPVTYAQMPKPVRIEAMKDMLTLAGAGTTLLALAKTAGAEVEVDPRSTDFGKIRVGNTRIDPWGGFQQWLRFYAQLGSGERKSTTTGKVTSLDGKTFPFETRLDLIASFGGQKLSPQASLLADLLRGENAMGEPLSINNTVLERMAPMYLQDIKEAVEELGVGGAAAVTVPGFFGVGVQTYKSKSNPFQSALPDATRR